MTPRRIQSLTPNTNQKYSVTCPESQRNHKQIRHIHNKQMHQKLLTIKDTLLSSQTSHPPQQSPHKPCRNHHKATRPTLPHQPRNHKTTIPEPASRTSQPHHHQSSSPENYTSTNQPAPAETTTTTNDHSNSQPHNRTRRSLNTHHTNVKSCPQQSHQGTTRTPTNPTPTSAKPKTHTTHPHHQHKSTKHPHLHPGPTYPIVAPLETYPVAGLLIDSPHDVSNTVPSNRKRDPQCGRAMCVCVMYFNNSHDAFRRAEPNCFGPVVQGHGLGIPARWHPYPRDHQ